MNSDTVTFFVKHRQDATRFAQRMRTHADLGKRVGGPVRRRARRRAESKDAGACHLMRWVSTLERQVVEA